MGRHRRPADMSRHRVGVALQKRVDGRILPCVVLPPGSRDSVAIGLGCMDTVSVRVGTLV